MAYVPAPLQRVPRDERKKRRMNHLIHRPPNPVTEQKGPNMKRVILITAFLAGLALVVFWLLPILKQLTRMM